jgi:MOSC domain-containing protein YiiM
MHVLLGGPLGKVTEMARILGLWTSPAKNSGRMDARDRVRAVEGHGLEGCAHARAGTKRQVLFASAQHLDDLGVEYGRIRETFTVEGADVHQWPVGQRVRIGEAEFEITMVCDPCERMDAIRPGLQAEIDGRRGMLARVVESGEVAAGDEIQLL